VKTSGFLHPYIYRYTARVHRDRFLAFEGEGMTWMRQPSWQGITLFSVRMEFWRSTTIPAIFRLRFVVLVRLAQSSFWNNRLDKSCRVCTAIVRKCFPFFLGVILGAGCACGREACGNRGPLKSHGKLLSDVECESCYSFHSTLKALCHGSHLELVPLYRRLEFAYLKISLLWPAQLHQPYELRS
jgi:hypothetical protein